jgi:FlaA1/EpsC-like NDP-sugar epimerase
MSKAQESIDNLRAWRRSMIWISQIGVFAFSAVIAFLLRFDFAIPQSYVHFLVYGIVIWTTVKIVVFRLLKLDRGLWRYVSIADVIRIGVANLIASVVGCGLILAIVRPGFPRSIYFIDLIVSLLGTSGLRLMARILQDASLSAQSSKADERRALIYGAGDAGITLLKEIRNNPRLLYRVIGFVDDEPQKRGLRVAGIPVLGTGETISAIVKKHNVKTILIAIPSASGSAMSQILEHCHRAGVDCMTVPGLGEVIENQGILGQVREVAVEDLLGRTPIHLQEGEILSTIEGKVILVTGAAGSIGSELCRQIARFHPAMVVGLDIAESPLFEIDREVRKAFPFVPFRAEIGSIQNRVRLDEVFRTYRPSVVYHAAAYKHVPLMETHVFEAIENNVFGTFNLAAAAKEYDVENFVMISSDKAVRSTNVMGATKRIAELLLLGLQNGGTQFVAVRFGNVLGSNGSVIPIFKKQIAAGGPITVTHPEMRRYFMTIPEACQLVLQASAIGKGGQICVLDMGSPVKIVDLAKKLILLSGLRPDEDIKIEFTGARPGEKLYEELSSLLEDTIPTDHEKIRIFVGNGVPENDMLTWLESLRGICETRDAGHLVVALKEIVEDYSPSTELLKRVIRFQDDEEEMEVGSLE